MQVLDPGHIYRVSGVGHRDAQYFKFVKRGGGAITYPREWYGIQTQVVMRAVIWFLQSLQDDDVCDLGITYPLWQLGAPSNKSPYKYFTLYGIDDTVEVVTVLIDRSKYLNNVLVCNETLDAIEWLKMVISDLTDVDLDGNRYEHAIHSMRMALWCYEARAYRRKQENVNRKDPSHDDSARLRSWRDLPADDVPFNEIDIEDRVIGPDGHIVL